MSIRKKPFRAYDGDKPYVFISYSHKDSERVYQIIGELHKKGYRVWYDEGIRDGKPFPDEIANAILKCTQFVCFLSHNAAQSKYVRNEICYAFAKDKPFLPVYLENTQLPPGLEMSTSTYQAIYKYEITESDFYRRMDYALRNDAKGKEKATQQRIQKRESPKKKVIGVNEPHKLRRIQQSFYNNKLEMWYQPIVDLEKEKIAKVEAIIKWEKAGDDKVIAQDLINQIIDKKFVDDLCYWTVDTILKDYNDFVRTKYFITNSITVSFKAPFRQFLTKEFTIELKKLMTEHKIPRDVICIEVIEGFFEDDFTSTMSEIFTIDRLGFLLSVDYIGEDHLSIFSLNNLYDFDEAKIDIQSIGKITSSEIRKKVEDADERGYDLIAYNLKTEDELRILASGGCNFYQGEYFYKPISKNDMVYIFNITD